LGFVHLFNECAANDRGERRLTQAARNDNYFVANGFEANGAYRELARISDVTGIVMDSNGDDCAAPFR